MNEERYIWKIREDWQDIIYDKKTNKRLRTDKESIVSLLNQQDQRIAELEEQLAESEKKHLLDEKEWQDYCAFKHIEPQIKGCLDRERELKEQLAEKEKLIKFYINSGKEQCEEINKLNHRALNYCDAIDKANQDKISFCIEQLEKVLDTMDTDIGRDVGDIIVCQINELKEKK